MGPAFDEHLQHALGTELVEHGAGLPRHLERGVDPGPVGGVTEDHSQRLVLGHRVDAHRELGVVGPNGPGADEHGVGHRPAAGGRRPAPRLR